MKKQTLYLNTSNQELDGYSERILKKTVAKFDCAIKVEVSKVNNGRTSKQNRYLHSIFNFLESESESGYTSHEFKELYRYYFLKYTEEIAGIEMVKYKSTADLDKVEFSEFVDRIRDHASMTFGIYVPTADEMNEYNNQEIN